jgi:hypothetical protein
VFLQNFLEVLKIGNIANGECVCVSQFEQMLMFLIKP